MDKGRAPPTLRRLGKVRAQARHQNAGQFEVEKNSRAYEEDAGKALAYVTS
jgi:hypothetical protein